MYLYCICIVLQVCVWFNIKPFLCFEELWYAMGYMSIALEINQRLNSTTKEVLHVRVFLLKIIRFIQYSSVVRALCIGMHSSHL